MSETTERWGEGGGREGGEEDIESAEVWEECRDSRSRGKSLTAGEKFAMLAGKKWE